MNWLFLLVALITWPIVFLVVVLPIVLFYIPDLVPWLFFMNWKRAFAADFSNPSAMGVKSKSRSFYLKGEIGRLGVWHILPQELSDRWNGSDQEMEQTVTQENFPIILYNHGNSCDRTMPHRVSLYNVLTDCGFHVFTFDYRGYGDSDGIPTEEGITRDACSVHDYVRPLCGKNPFYIWGHSLGTAISIRLVRQLSLEGIAPDGLVIESAFNNLHDVVIHHPFAMLFRHLPHCFVDKYIISHFRKKGLTMESDERIRQISCKILQLHAADDFIIPVKLGRKLSKAAKAAGRELDYLEFGAERQLGHKFVYKAEELPEEVKKFTMKCRKD